MIYNRGGRLDTDLMKPYLFLPLMIFVAVINACSYEPPGSSEAPSTDDDDETQQEEVRPLYLEVGLKWEGATEYKTVLDCKTPVMPANGQTYNCSITIPEAQLYYSDVRFRVGTSDALQCPLVSFHPYYYKRSNLGNYVPPNGEEIDCTPGNTTPLSPNCYGGAGPAILGETISQYTGRYFVSAVGKRADFEVPSENTTQWYKGYAVNYRITNDLATAARATGVTTGAKTRVAGTYFDYRAACRNIWGEHLFSLLLTISDENQTNNPTGTLDEYDDWN